MTRRRRATRSKLGQPFDYGSGPIRVVWGPQDDYFSDKGRRTFVESDYRVSKEADRMGIRFEGPTIEHSKGADIISDGIGPGAIQVPGAGLPIVLLGDRQTVGGYSKIATVASVDLPRLGRLLPGQVVRFAPVTVEEAEKLRRDQEARLQRAIADFKTARPPGGIDLVRLYEENLIDGVVYEMTAGVKPCGPSSSPALVGSSLQFPARAAPALKVIYVGGWDCQPCTAWKNKYKAGWLASPEYKQVTWIEVDAPKLKEAYQERYWPGDLKPILDQLPRKSGTPRFLHRRRTTRSSPTRSAAGQWPKILAELKKQLS